jgi:hypothetical protein
MAGLVAGLLSFEFLAPPMQGSWPRFDASRAQSHLKLHELAQPCLSSADLQPWTASLGYSWTVPLPDPPLFAATCAAFGACALAAARRESDLAETGNPVSRQPGGL